MVIILDGQKVFTGSTMPLPWPNIFATNANVQSASANLLVTTTVIGQYHNCCLPRHV